MNITRKSKTRSMVYTALFAVLLTVCTWLYIPAAVPFTMQTFAVFAASMLLGGKRALAAVAVYLALGCMGLPVFAGFQGGFGVLTGPTGGYLIGFFFIPLLHLACEKCGGRALEILCLAVGLIVCYAFGTAFFVLVYMRTGGAAAFGAAVLSCVAPYVLPDAAKLLLAFLLADKLRKRISF